MLEHIYLIPLMPLAAALVIFFFGEKLPGKGLWIGILAMAAAAVQSWTLFFQHAAGALKLPFELTFEWFRFGVYGMDLGVYVDGLTLSMLIVVTTVSLLVQVYSLGYMHGDLRIKRFYSYLSMFSFAMLALVVSNSVFIFFMSWELVGVCSYLLISFWFEKPEAAYAGKKAFITTKLGDLGLFLGVLLLFATAGTLRISSLMTYVDQHYLTSEMATAIGLLLFFGAMGKSAQFPLFIWLPDAMEGPTPVSALIHAATMVAAGVYLVARLYFIYAIAPQALTFIAWTGAITAFLAGTMALVAYDIKRVLAFSTISQLGYMMLALGVGDLTAGMFHLTTHAFFKALLFLGAGSVIHAVHTNDMREMGGLSRVMPFTFSFFMIATLAISGIPPFAGYFSKEAILAAVAAKSMPLFWIAAGTAGMTTFYMFRLCFMTFFGVPRDMEKNHHAHESPAVMTVPLGILAILAAVSGAAFEYLVPFEHFVKFEMPKAAEGLAHGQIATISLALAATAILSSWYLYLKSPETSEKLKKTFMPVFNMLEARYGLDRAALLFVDLGDLLARAFFWFDYNVIDQFFVDGFGTVTSFFSWIGGLFDDYVIDGLMVNGMGFITEELGAGLRAAQTGLVQNYLLYVALTAGLFAVLVWMR
jgi:NADH-quinone oxidoreductase subunit L